LLHPARVLPYALLAAVLVGGGAHAQEATPVALAPIDLGSCVTERPPDERLRQLATEGYAIAVAAVASNRADEATPDVTSPVAATPLPSPEPSENGEAGSRATPTGTPADADTAAAVTETITQFAACSNAGKLTAIPTLLTDAGARRYLGFSILVFVQIGTGSDEPPAELDPALLEAYLAATAIRVPLPPEFRTNLYEIGEIVDLGDGRVRASVVLSQGDEPPGETPFLLREQDGRYVILFGPKDAAAAATPVAAPTA